MKVEPSAEVFAERYARGDTQVVWTNLVSDLETPVSAFLKIAGGKPMSFLLESVEGGATRGRYSIIGIEPDVIWRTVGDHAEINRSARMQPDTFVPCPEPPLMALRSLIAESRIELPHDLPPMAAGVFGYLGYDMVRLMEELSAPNPDPIAIPDALLMRPTVIIVFDAVTATITVVTPVRPRAGVGAKAALAQATERLSDVVHSLDRPLDMSDGAGRQGVHRGRRHFSGGALATFRGAVHAVALCALSRVAAGQSGAVSVLPRFRQFRRGRIEPGNSGAGARRPGDHSPDCRHAAARRDTA
jgi:anthranilate synthase component 1